MSALCFYFQVHQPYRLRHYTFFDIGVDSFYEDEDANCGIMLKVARKCYLPMNALLLKLIRKYDGRFKVSFSISGTALDQFEAYAPEVIQSFRELVATGCVELLSETYNHSLAFLYSPEEFREQVALARRADRSALRRNAPCLPQYGTYLQQRSGRGPWKRWATRPCLPRVRITCSAGAARTSSTARRGAIASSFCSRITASRTTSPSGSRTTNGLNFRSRRTKFSEWAHAANASGDLINLFMDYETFGEHQWESTGIFAFMEALPEVMLRTPGFAFITPSEAAARFEPVASPRRAAFHVVGGRRARSHRMARQRHAERRHRIRLSLGEGGQGHGDPRVLRTWRRLQTSDHFYYMSTKWFSDGDVHSYFNPYGTPYDAYINYMNVLADFRLTLDAASPLDPGTKSAVLESA